MQKQLNLKIKFRESFRPFAPSVLAERVSDYFELDRESPYMLLVAPVSKQRRRQLSKEEATYQGISKLDALRSDIPAVTHVDYSARVQTVSQRDNPRFYGLIKEFENITGYGILVNTSFNVRGEPIVCTPQDAYECFMHTEMDHLVLWPFLLAKWEQPVYKCDKQNWGAEWVPD